jgi:hypothetical protein
LGEEAAADGGLLADGADAKGGEWSGVGEVAVVEEEDGGGVVAVGEFGGIPGLRIGTRGTRLDYQGAELGDGADEFVGELGCGADLLPVFVERGGEFEVEVCAGGLALGDDLVEQGLAASGEEVEDAGGFGGVLGGCAGGRISLFTGHEALVHLAVDAAWVVGIGLEVFIAAAEFEEIEHGVAVALGGGAGRERTEGLGEGLFAEAICCVDAWMLVRDRDAEEVGCMEAEALACLVGTEGGAGCVVEQQGGFEVGAGAGVVDEADAVAEVEALREDRITVLVEGFGRGEKPAEAAA